MKTSVCEWSKPTAMRFPYPGVSEWFLSPHQGEPGLQRVATHTRPLPRKPQWALCHLINQTWEQQVAHRSQPRRRVRENQRMCTPHARPPKRKSISRHLRAASQRHFHLGAPTVLCHLRHPRHHKGTGFRSSSTELSFIIQDSSAPGEVANQPSSVQSAA